MKISTILATLRLFNGVLKDKNNISIQTEPTLKRTIRNGYIIDNTFPITDDILDNIETILGISGEKANASFHKSWDVVKNTPMEILFTQQILHYIITYGFEALGIYNNGTIYIPNEKLEIPNIKDDIKLIVVKGMTKEEIYDSVLKLCSGVALSEQSITDIITIIIDLQFDKSIIDHIKNRELLTKLYDYFDIAPTKPVEYLRYVVNQLTDESLIIKNDYLISKIKESNSRLLDHLLKKAPKNLSSIFLRYKPLFLAMKSISKNKTFFNKLRRDAKKTHKPLKGDYLNDITSMIKNNKKIDKSFLIKKLNGASVFRKIRLAYALGYRLNSDTKSISYIVRNGKSWSTDFQWSWHNDDIAKDILDIVLNSIADSIKEKVQNKTFYIPNNIHYAIPATEKQFVGNIPSKSYVSVDQDMVAGIHWFNNEDRIDLDLSIMNDEGKIGWDHEYRNDARTVLFSGDVTDAPRPKGASELFYFSNLDKTPWLINVNFYNFNEAHKCNCKVFVAKQKPRVMKRNYMVDPNNILMQANVEIDKKQSTLGLMINKDNENRFYFLSTGSGNSITANMSEHMMHMRNYLISSTFISFGLDDILKRAEGTIINDVSDTDDYIDLSPEALNKTTILDIFI